MRSAIQERADTTTRTATGPSSRPAQRTTEERNGLVEQYLPLVHHVVSRMRKEKAANLTRDEFVSAGVVGLMQAAATYDPDRGASFKTFAYTIIQGAILDELRRHDPVPRGRRERLRATDHAATELRARLGRAPTMAELAEVMGESPEDLEADRVVMKERRTASLDAPLQSHGSTDASAAAGRGFIDERAMDPGEALASKEMTALVTEAINELPDSERKVVVLYHYKNLYLKEIGALTGVTESRVSQVLTSALQRLRIKLVGRVPPAE